MRKIEQYEAFDETCFATEADCRAYELSLEDKIRERFFELAYELEGENAEYLGIPYWTEEHTVYALIPKTISDIQFLNAIGMMYADNTVHNKYSSIYRNGTWGDLHNNGDNLFKISDLNTIVIVEFGYGGGNSEWLFDSDFINVWEYDELMNRQTEAIHNLMRNVE